MDASDSPERTAPPNASPPSPPSLKRRILRGTVWSAVGRIASIGALILGNMALAWAWESDKGLFAAYAVAAAAVILLGFPSSVGAPKIITRFIREGIHSGNHQLLHSRLRSSTRLLLISSAATAVLVTIVPPLLMRWGWLSDAQKWRAMTEYSGLVAGWLVTSSLCMSVSQALMGFDDFRTAALVGARNGGVISNVAFLAAVLVLWATGFLSLASVLWSQVVTNSLGLAVGTLALRRVIAEQLPPRERFVDASHRELAGLSWVFQESWPNFIIQMTSMGIIPMELLVLSTMASDGEIADYTAVQRLQEVLTSAQTLSTTIVAPFITELYTKGDLQRLQSLLRGAATFVAIPTLAILVVYALFPAFTLTHTFGPAYANGAWALRIAAIGGAVACLAGPNGLTMVMTGRQRELLRLSIAACLIYLVAAFPMIYFFGIAGAAAAVAIVFGIYNVVVTLLIKSRIGVWTTPTLAPRQLRHTLEQLRGRRRPAAASVGVET